MKEEDFIEGVDDLGKTWWTGIQRELKKHPPLGHKNLDDLEFYTAHVTKAEEWAARGDPNYIAALATVAPKEAEKFVKIARQVAAEEAARNYA